MYIIVHDKNVQYSLHSTLLTKSNNYK